MAGGAYLSGKDVDQGILGKIGESERLKRVSGRIARAARKLALPCVATLMLALAPPALAVPTTVSVDTAAKRVDVIAGFNTPNFITVIQSGDWRITDTAGIIIDPGSATECTRVDANTADCADPGFDQNPNFPDFELKVAARDGDDTVVVNAASTVDADLNLGDGDDSVLSTGTSNDTIRGNLGSDTMDAGAGSDVIFATTEFPDVPDTSSNILRGGPGGDQLEGGRGNDEFDEGSASNGGDNIQGGNGNDTINYEHRTNGVVIAPEDELLDFGTLSGESGENDIIREDIETVIGGAGDDRIFGGRTPNLMVGGPGADIICGRLGEDTVDYSAYTGPSPGSNITVTLGAADTTLSGALDGVATTITVASTRGFTGTGTLRIGSEQITYTGTTETTFTGATRGANGTSAASHSSGALVHIAAADDCEFPGREGLTDERGGDDCLANDGGASDVGAGGRRDCIGEDVENVIGGAGDDTLLGNDPRLSPIFEPRAGISGKNVFWGGPGNDLFDGGRGPDKFFGETGTDTVTYAGIDADRATSVGRTEPIRATLDETADDGNEVSDVDRTNPEAPQFEVIQPGVEHVIGGSGGDVMRGGEGAETFEGRGGNDLIDAGGGADRVFGGFGDDTLKGSGGTDEVRGHEGADDLQGGDGDDQLDGGADNDRLVGNAGSDHLAGGPGTDLVDYSAELVPVNVSTNDFANDGVAGEGDNVGSDVESLSGGIDADRLVANGGDGIVSGGGGDDVLDGGAGADVLLGGDGADSADYSGRTAPINADLSTPGGDGEAGENDNLAGDVEKLFGGAAGDVLTGDGAGNVLIGGGGNDTLVGNGGFDLILAGGGEDLLDGGEGRDVLRGDDDNDRLGGGGGEDTLEGGGGDDMLDGGAGADTLGAVAGSDTADYGARTADVSITLDGAADDGESNEGDFIRTDVLNVSTGGGDDSINSRDGKNGKVACGGGRDVVDADTDDDVAGNCEVVNRVTASNRCSVSAGTLTLKGSTVSVRVRCPVAARGTVTLETAGAVRAVNDAAKRKAARKMRLGRKSFTITRPGQRKAVRIKIASKLKRLINRRNRLRIRAIVSARPRGVQRASNRTVRSTRTLTVKASKRKG